MTTIKIKISAVDGTDVIYRVSTKKKYDHRAEKYRYVWNGPFQGELVPPMNGRDMVHIRTESGSPDYRLIDFPRKDFTTAVDKIYGHRPLGRT